MYRKTRDTMVTTINSVPGLTGSSQGNPVPCIDHPDHVPIHILNMDIPIALQTQR